MERSRDRGRRRSAACSIIGVAAIGGASLVLLLSPSRALAYDANDVRAIVMNDVPADSFPGQGGVWMARQRLIEIDGVGNGRVTDHILARVFDPAWGELHFSNYAIPYWSALQGVRPEVLRIWHSATEVVDLPKSAIRDEADPEVEHAKAYVPRRRVVIQFPELKAGDVIEMRYSRADNVQGGETNVRSGEFLFGCREATVEQELILSVPDAMELNIQPIGANLMRSRRALGEFKEYRYLTGHLPPLGRDVLDGVYGRSATGSDSVPAIYPRVLFTPAQNWDFFSDYFGFRFEGHAAIKDAGMNLTVSRLTAGVTDLQEKCELLERYVQKDIATLPFPQGEFTYRPIDAAEVYRSGAAIPRDKTVYLASLLRGAGLRATPVLLHTGGPRFEPAVPAIDQFDRFVIRVQLPDDRTVWLDAVESSSALPAGKALILPPREERAELGLIDYPGRAGR